MRCYPERATSLEPLQRDDLNLLAISFRITAVASVVDDIALTHVDAVVRVDGEPQLVSLGHQMCSYWNIVGHVAIPRQ
jgi:hypothetical protein